MVKKATKTLALIDKVMEADQGAGFRQALRLILPKIEDAYRGESKPYRKHLGASLIGRDCSRYLFYNFRWCKVQTHEARIVRLFNRGHLEEARFLAMFEILKNYGVEFWYETEDGGQFTFQDHGGHFGSALDGVVRNIPDLPANVPAYAEFKTSANKGFQKMEKEGVRSAKHEHFIQCQICMHKMQLPHTLYMMVNKDNDDLYAEIIDYDQAIAEHYLQRAGNIIFARVPPEPISQSAAWYECKFCPFLGVCKQGVAVDKNCRTCQHAIPTKWGTWRCSIPDEHEEYRQDIINSDAAMQGCQDYKTAIYLR